MKNAIKKEPEGQKEKKAKKPRKKNGFSKILNSMLNGEFLTREGFVKHLPFMAYLAFLFILFIGLGYYYENTLRNLTKYEGKLEKIKHEYHTTLYRLEKLRLQSKLREDMSSLGLNKTVEQPKIIEVEKGYFEQEQ